LQKAAAISFRHDAVWANRKRNNNVPINDEQDAVFFGHIQIENLVTMPAAFVLIYGEPGKTPVSL